MTKLPKMNGEVIVDSLINTRMAEVALMFLIANRLVTPTTETDGIQMFELTPLGEETVIENMVFRFQAEQAALKEPATPEAMMEYLAENHPNGPFPYLLSLAKQRLNQILAAENKTIEDDDSYHGMKEFFRKQILELPEMANYR